MRVLFTLGLSCLAVSYANADCSSVSAQLGHTSCKTLKAACESAGAGVLALARTTSVEGGYFECTKCKTTSAEGDTSFTKFAVEGGGDGVDVGKGFQILKGKGLDYTLGTLGVVAALYLLAMCMEKHDADDAASRGTQSAEGLGCFGRACRFARLFCLRRTGYVQENGKPYGYLGMVRETQPWELMYCYTCGYRFNCAKDSVKKSWLRWAHFYYGICLSLGLSIMFSALVLSEQAKGCHYDTDEDGNAAWYAWLPLEHFTETYLVVLVLCKLSDTAVAYLTTSATHRNFCVSQLIRWLLIAVGALFVAAALYFQYDVQKLDDVDVTTAMKVWAYAKMVLITRGTIWLFVTPATTLLCYLTGRCLYREPKETAAAEVGGFSLTGMHAAGDYDQMESPPASIEDGSAPSRAARSTLAPGDWQAGVHGGPITGVVAGAPAGNGAPSAPAWSDRPVSVTRL